MNQWVIEHNKHDLWWGGLDWVKDKDYARFYNDKEQAEEEILDEKLDAHCHNEG